MIVDTILRRPARNDQNKLPPTSKTVSITSHVGFEKSAEAPCNDFSEKEGICMSPIILACFPATIPSDFLSPPPSPLTRYGTDKHYSLVRRVPQCSPPAVMPYSVCPPCASFIEIPPYDCHLF